MDTLNTPERVIFAAELDSFLQRRFGYRRGLTFLSPINTLQVSRKKVDLYLRLWQAAPNAAMGWPEKTVVIARIGFDETRVGHGRALLKFLTQQAPRFGYDKIGIENTHEGDNIQGFVRKLGFKPVALSRRPNANWIAPVSKIAARLASFQERPGCNGPLE